MAITGHVSLSSLPSILNVVVCPYWSILEYRMRTSMNCPGARVIRMSSLVSTLSVASCLCRVVNSPTRRNPKKASRSAALNIIVSYWDKHTNSIMGIILLSRSSVMGLLSSPFFLSLLLPSCSFFITKWSVGFAQPCYIDRHQPSHCM